MRYTKMIEEIGKAEREEQLLWMRGYLAASRDYEKLTNTDYNTLLTKIKLKSQDLAMLPVPF